MFHAKTTEQLCEPHLDPAHLHLGEAPAGLQGVEVRGQGEQHPALRHAHLGDGRQVSHDGDGDDDGDGDGDGYGDGAV